MKKKIICIGIVSMFLLTGLTSFSAVGIKTNGKSIGTASSSYDYCIWMDVYARILGENIPLTCEEFETDVTITDISDPENPKVVKTLTEKDFECGFPRDNLCHITLEEGLYNIHISVEPYHFYKYTSQEKQDTINTNNQFVWFVFKPNNIPKRLSHSFNPILYKIINKFPLLQLLL